MPRKFIRPSFWYLAVSLLLGVTAYPSVTWLPKYVEQFRYGGVGLLPSHLLFARQLGGGILFLSLILLVFFILSAFFPSLHKQIYFQAWGCGLILIYTLYALLLMMCFATLR
jgi:hypothetical protein